MKKKHKAKSRTLENKDSKTEIEYKFASLANTQLKFIPTESAEIILKKIGVLCNLLNIKFGDSKQLEIVDEYYDDQNYSLKKSNCNFRRRCLANGEHLVTIKSGKEDAIQKGLQQRFEDEFNCSDKDFKNFINDPESVCKRIKNNFNIDVACNKLTKLLTVRNRRTGMKINTQVAEYTLCYDKYYFFDDLDGDYSEYFAEIEIELSGQHLSDDMQLTKLRTAIIELLNYVPNPSTKLERGLVRNTDEGIETVYVMGLDIVEYSKRPANIQKQIIQKLNHYSKEAIREIRGSGAEHFVIYLPTGDGMILVFEDKPETIVPIIFNIQNKIKNYNKTNSLHDKFEFRTGLHSGQVFKYSDINENLNFAGNGINLTQRVMNMGDKWHILATKEGYESMGNINSKNRPFFSRLGNYPIKHGDEIEVYNVYSQEEHCGNPTEPLK